MERPTIGDVISIAFPFSDLRAKKRRPALVIGIAEFDDLITCQITSKSYSSKKAILLSSQDFKEGGLGQISYIRSDKIFTLDSSLIQGIVGKLKYKKINEVHDSVKNLFVLSNN